MKTTKKNFDYFRECCLSWQQKFNLQEWELYFKHKFLKNSYSEIKRDFSSMKAVIVLSTEWDDRAINQNELNISACHELLHLLLAPLICRTGEYSDKIIDEDEHSIINKMVKYLISL